MLPACRPRHSTDSREGAGVSWGHPGVDHGRHGSHVYRFWGGDGALLHYRLRHIPDLYSTLQVRKTPTIKKKDQKKNSWLFEI